jgi:hypothetical protein
VNFTDPQSMMGILQICRELSDLTATYADQQCIDGKITGTEEWVYQNKVKAVYMPKCPAARAIMNGAARVPLTTPQRPTEQLPPTNKVDCGNAVNCAGTNSGIQQVNLYGAPQAPPAITHLATSLEPAVPQPGRLPNMTGPTWMGIMDAYRQGESGPLWNPGLRLSFQVSTPFTDPQFRVRCDRPCIASKLEFHSPDGGGSVVNPQLEVTGDPVVVIFGGLPGIGVPLMPDARVVLIVRSQDDKPIASATVAAQGPSPRQ